VVILDELGAFLASKDRSGLNADASFLQWLAQRTATSRCWLVCATQRGMEGVGDIDGRTLRQVRDRFRAGFTLDLSELEWVVRHKVVPRREESAFRTAMAALAEGYREAAGEELVSAGELGAAYPVNPLCLKALRRAAETHLSRTRSAAKLLRETVQEGGWLELPADRLITLDVVFDVFRDEIAMSAAGRKQLQAFAAVMANASRIARGEEARVAHVMKALCVLGLGEVRWSERELRASFVGCEDEGLWRNPEALRDTLKAIYQRGAYVERSRGEATDGDTFYVDVSSDASAQMRERLNELVAELVLGDSRVLRAALEACRDPSFPLAALAQPRRLPVMWLKARRYVEGVCCDLRGIEGSELSNRVGMLAASVTREDGVLFVASPMVDVAAQEEAWREASAGVEGRFTSAALAWMPAQLDLSSLDHLLEHAALTLMVTDKTLFGRRGGDFRDRVRERWSASEEEVRRVLHRAYYDGALVAADGRDPVPEEQLAGLFGDWEGTLAAIFSEPFRTLFPRFPQVAPARPLASRAQINDLVEQFIRPGEVTLPPASALEAHLEAYAEPLGLVDGTGGERRLVLKQTGLIEAALSATPGRSSSEEIDPSEAVAFGELAGRLCKSEWGLTREQAELVISALIRTGHLVALDAFVQPLRLEQVGTPLDQGIQYVMRGRPLGGETAEKVKRLWEGASGHVADTWDLPTQERAWGFFVQWARGFSEGGRERAEAITRAAVALGHDPASWDWAREALGSAEAVARVVDPTLTSREGLAALVSAVDRLPGGNQQTRERIADWRACERFLSEGVGAVARPRELVATASVSSEEGLLARERESVLARFDDSREVVCASAEVKAAGERWLENYRKHYLAWHGRVHAAARFEPLLALRRSAEMDAMRRLGRAGLWMEEAAKIEAELGAALGRRCLAGDPLSSGHVVCPICEVGFKEEVALPEQAEVRARIADVIERQLAEVRGEREMLGRRLEACDNERVREGIKVLLASKEVEAGTLAECLTDEVVAWLRDQLGQPKARRRELADLVARLQGKELTKGEVLRIVAEWLGEEEGFVEMV
jgi:hypothetical protein